MYNRFIAVAVETMHDQIATKSDNRRQLSDRLEAAATAIRRDSRRFICGLNASKILCHLKQIEGDFEQLAQLCLTSRQRQA